MLTSKLKVSVLSYRSYGAGIGSQELELWERGKIVRDFGRVGDQPLGDLHAQASEFDTIARDLVIKSALYVPACADGDEQKIAALIKRYPTARAYAFRFYGTSGRVMPPSTWQPLAK
jgi:hypothetical protein